MAWTFHFPPSDLWEMDAAELDFWADEAKRIADARRSD
ncbi:GpE family phage tail protein [Rhodocyclus purpureus]